MIEQIEDYFSKGCGRCAKFDTENCSAKLWKDGLSKLRHICLETGLSEHVKWGHPCYMHANRNIAIIGAFKDNFRLSFMNASLLKDPEGILEKQGANTQHADMIKFTDVTRVEALSTIIQAYLREAMDYAEKDIKPQKTVRELDWPDELAEALDADHELAEAFHALTPGRQRSYFFNLNSTQSPQTRMRRIEKFREKIMLGKGALER